MNWLVNPEGHGAAALSTLGWFVVVTFVVAILAIWVALGVLALRRRRGSFAEHAPIDDPSGKSWVVIGGLVVPGIVFLIFLVFGLVTMHAAPVESHMHDKPDVIIIGHQWWWELRYPGDEPDQLVISANEVHIPTGRTVTLELRSDDVIHSFWVPNLHGKVDLVPGHPNYMQLEADVPGRYEGQCSEFCGEQHAKMRIVLIAQSPRDYEAWLRAQRLPGVQPTKEPAIEGQELFVTRACGVCHTVRGTRALGTIGPDLTHLASRTSFASGTLPMKHAYLQGWVMRAQTLKPDIEMPNLAQFTGEELNALVAYLRQLQ